MRPLNKKEMIEKEKGDLIKGIERIIDSLKELVSLFKEVLISVNVSKSNFNADFEKIDKWLDLIEWIRDRKIIKSLGFKDAFSEICDEFLDIYKRLGVNKTLFNNNFSKGIETQNNEELEDKIRSLSEKALEMIMELIKKL